MALDKITAPQVPILGVGAVIWNRKGEIVLIRRRKPPRFGEWSIPGGHVEWGETIRAAILREVREETGLAVEILGLIDIVDSIMRGANDSVERHYVLADFACRLISGDLRASDDASAAFWVSCAALDDYPLWSETRRIIEISAAMAA